MIEKGSQVFMKPQKLKHISKFLKKNFKNQFFHFFTEILLKRNSKFGENTKKNRFFFSLKFY